MQVRFLPRPLFFRKSKGPTHPDWPLIFWWNTRNARWAVRVVFLLFYKAAVFALAFPIQGENIGSQGPVLDGNGFALRCRTQLEGLC